MSEVLRWSRIENSRLELSHWNTFCFFKSGKASTPTQPLRFGCKSASHCLPGLLSHWGLPAVSVLYCLPSHPQLHAISSEWGKTPHSRKLPPCESAGWLRGDVWAPSSSWASYLTHKAATRVAAVAAQPQGVQCAVLLLSAVGTWNGCPTASVACNLLQSNWNYL